MREATAERRLEENVEGVENTVIQIRNAQMKWVDYSRTTQSNARSFIASRPEAFRAVDWITKEVL